MTETINSEDKVLREEFKKLNPTLFNLSYIVMNAVVENKDGELYLSQEKTDQLVQFLYEFTEKEFRKYKAMREIELNPSLKEMTNDSCT
jgi:hypothetical protein